MSDMNYISYKNNIITKFGILNKSKNSIDKMEQNLF